MLDRRKIGIFEFTDLQETFVQNGIFLTKQDLGIIFAYLDTSKDGRVNYYEFLKFWNYTP